MMVLFAIVAYIGRFAVYHQIFDDLMLMFLLVPLGIEAAARRSLRGGIAFMLLAIMLWLPIYGIMPTHLGWLYHAFRVIQFSAATWALGTLLLLSRQTIHARPLNAS